MISNSISPVPEAKDFLKTDLTQENNQSGLGNLFPVPKAKNISCTEFHLFAFSMETVCLRACWFKSRLLGSPLATRFASGHQVRLWPPVTPSLGHYASSSLGDELDENAGHMGRL